LPVSPLCARSSAYDPQPSAPTAAPRSLAKNAAARRQAAGLSAATLRELRTAFDRYDVDRSGSITQAELSNALAAAGVAPDPQSVAAAFAKADTNRDGAISFAEFCDLHISQQRQAAQASASTSRVASSSETERAASARVIQQRVQNRRAARGSSRSPKRRPNTRAHFQPVPVLPLRLSSNTSISGRASGEALGQAGSLPPSLRSSLRDSTSYARPAPQAYGACESHPTRVHDRIQRDEPCSLACDVLAVLLHSSLRLLADAPHAKGSSPRRELALRLRNLANDMAEGTWQCACTGDSVRSRDPGITSPACDSIVPPDVAAWALPRTEVESQDRFRGRLFGSY
jgi:3-methyladenine DNA glycosylase Tag